MRGVLKLILVFFLTATTFITKKEKAFRHHSHICLEQRRQEGRYDAEIA